MSNRLFTVDEQERLDRRIEMLSRAYMWTKRTPASARANRVFCDWLALGFPLLVFCICLVIIACRGMAVPSPGIWAYPLLAGIIVAIVELIWAAVRFVHVDDLWKKTPPVLIFFDDKLFMIDSDGSFDSAHGIPSISRGEIQALRESAPVPIKSLSSSMVCAECFYLDAIAQYEIGNDTPGLRFTVIEDIVDVRIAGEDEGEESRGEGAQEDQSSSDEPDRTERSFIIEYEDNGISVSLELDYDLWSDLCIWLQDQMRPA